MSVFRPGVYTIPLNRSFADALAAGLIARFGGDVTGLARGLILLPNQRAVRAMSDAFVRHSGGGLLLPRLVPIGDPDLEERAGSAFEPLDGDGPIPPAIEPLERLMRLARLVQTHRGVAASEALRLAEDLARTLDQMQVEEVEISRLKKIAADLPDLSIHWQSSLESLAILLDQWPKALAAAGRIDLAERRNRLLDGLTRRWRTAPPAGFVCAAGITVAAPSVAKLLRMVARLESGLVVLPGIDLRMKQPEWDALGPHEPNPVTGRRDRSIESHPQFQLKRLLDRMGVARDEVALWRHGASGSAPSARARAIANALAPAAYSDKWQRLPPQARRLSGVRVLELADPAEEAQAIAIALREALETPGRTAALVTPDRSLARRVSAQLRRWGIEADDSAGRPLSQMPAGVLLLALAEAAAERFAPVPLLALLTHPLVRAGEERLAWLEGARWLDLALRGPRPPAGLAGIAARLAEPSPRESVLRARAAEWWREVAPLLALLEAAFAAGSAALPELIEALRRTASELTGEAVWQRADGRSAAELFTNLAEATPHGPAEVGVSELPSLLERLLAAAAVRPPYGQHPRIFIWGLIEARLQHADLMVLGGMNEGVWPALPAPDAWLAPRIRAELGLPALERRIGLAAHDFALALGAPQVIITRARRDARSPTVASRLWLRLEAMTGGVTRAPLHRKWARAIDRPSQFDPACRPAPAPEQPLRPRSISVTDVDRLKADPFAFYARSMLRLAARDVLDADPTPAWRGNAVHAVLEAWFKEDDCDPARLRSRAEALLRANAAHPLMRALWEPRLLEAIDFIAAEAAANREGGRRPLAAEITGRCEIGGVTLRGTADRIDRLTDGSLAIVDYKTGRPPSPKAVAEGYSLQLGLLGLIAERGGFPGVEGVPSAFEYWSFARKKDRLGFVESPVDRRGGGVAAADFTAVAAREFADAAGKWLLGDAPFTAKLNPAYAPYGDYDQLMRLEEWYGREI